MAHTAQRAYIDSERLRAIQAALDERALDGWLLYDFHAMNPVAGRVLGLLQPLSRRYFVLIPVEGEPVAVAHSLELPPWSEWTGDVQVYFKWQELEKTLAELLTPGQRVAMEYSENDKVPGLDRVPAGVLDLIKRTGVHPVESGDLATLFAATWSEAELESHRRVSNLIANIAARAFKLAADAVRSRAALSEWGLKESIIAMMDEAGLVEGDTIVGVGANAADGHYEPTPDGAAPIVEERVLLIDLWAREPGSVFSDQTWMGFMGTEIPGRLQEVWRAVHGAREAAVKYVADHHADPDTPLRGCDVDGASRAVIEQAGFSDRFNHRTGHSIDNEIHGLGPNIDGAETNDVRRLLPGVAFSIEPGVYIAEEGFGVRSEINVYLGQDGPEVTTPKPQDEIYPLLSDGWESSSNL
ncbi:MAG: aminopeptidase P family protein [Gemmatimonadota bacterium]|nr:MAG: aminopeptidase P family protein [Gemmatimonadota bacterium]